MFIDQVPNFTPEKFKSFTIEEKDSKESPLKQRSRILTKMTSIKILGVDGLNSSDSGSDQMDSSIQSEAESEKTQK